MIFRSTFSKPILLAGNGIRSAGAVDKLHEFQRKTNIPVLTTMPAVDLVQDDRHIGFIGTHGNRIANMMISHCDVLISVGARLGIRQVGRNSENFAANAELYRCDIDEYELSRGIKHAENKIRMDAGEFLEQLINEPFNDYGKWWEQCVEAKRLLDKYDKQIGNYAVEKIAYLLPRDPVVTVDVGMHQCWCAQSLVLQGEKGRIHISGGYGTMGCSLPFAIGSSVSMKGKPVYCITGDGGFQMNIQELEVVKREKLPIKILVLNNKVLGKISETQHLEHDDRFANTTASGGYSVPDFSSISEAYGIRTAHLDGYMELDNYKEWFYDNMPCLIDIVLPEANILTPKIRFDTFETYPKLDMSVIDKVESILSR